MEHTPKVHCPICNSDQLHISKKGFSGTKAVVGGLLTGGIGVLAGTHGMNRLQVTCIACGHVFSPKPATDNQQAQNKEPEKIDSFGCIVIIIALAALVVFFKACF